MSEQAQNVISGFLRARLDAPALDFLKRSAEEISPGISNSRMAALVSLASRYARNQPLGLSPAELAAAQQLVPGWNPERWSVLDAVRVALILARSDLTHPSFAETLEECFRYADAGELCALYRSFALLPQGERFRWRAAEGCRTNMRSVFEAVACDTPYPVQQFDDIAWRQLVIKAVFIDAPLWRVYGLDTRLSEELARMALDLADERRSAGRPVQPQLWLCLGKFGGTRAIEAMEKELRLPNPDYRRAAVLGLGRAQALPRLKQLLDTETDPFVRTTIEQVLNGRVEQTTFKELALERL
jgi:hypothetical protein